MRAATNPSMQESRNIVCTVSADEAVLAELTYCIDAEPWHSNGGVLACSQSAAGKAPHSTISRSYILSPLGQVTALTASAVAMGNQQVRPALPVLATLDAGKLEAEGTGQPRAIRHPMPGECRDQKLLSGTARSFSNGSILQDKPLSGVAFKPWSQDAQARLLGTNKKEQRGKSRSGPCQMGPKEAL